jgi:hypothetical protein
MLSKIARELLRRPVLLLSLSVAAILLGIAILLLARLPPPTEAPTLWETPSLVASPAMFTSVRALTAAFSTDGYRRVRRRVFEANVWRLRLGGRELP